MNKVLDVQNLHVSFDTYAGEVKAVRGVTFSLSEGEVLAIVGESGCGKSVTAQTIMKLNPMPPARIKEGSVQLGEHDIVAANEKEMQKIRGKEVSMIFQDPMTSLNPTMRIGKQIMSFQQGTGSVLYTVVLIIAGFQCGGDQPCNSRVILHHKDQRFIHTGSPQFAGV